MEGRARPFEWYKLMRTPIKDTTRCTFIPHAQHTQNARHSKKRRSKTNNTQPVRIKQI